MQDAKEKAGSCKTLVDKVGGDDIDYLEDERAAIKELKEILAGMDLGVKHKKTKTFSKAASEFVKCENTRRNGRRALRGRRSPRSRTASARSRRSRRAARMTPVS